MRRADLGLVVAAIAMVTIASLRVSAYWRGPDIAAESIATAKPVPPFAAGSVPAKPWPRPLFKRSNSEADALDAAAAGGLGSGAELPRLIGVIINQSDRVAILGYGGKVQHLQENARIGVWTISRIERRSATLRNASEFHLLQLDPAAR